MKRRLPRLLLDQMLDHDVAQDLRGHGWDAVRVSEIGLAQADDVRILEAAIQRKWVLVTLDEHFGDWTVLPLRRHPGVIRIKVKRSTTAAILDSLSAFLSDNEGRSFKNCLVIVRDPVARWIRTDGS